MPIFVIRERQKVDADPNDYSGAIITGDIANPGTYPGLPTIEQYAQQIVVSPLSAPFTPIAAISGPVFSTSFDDPNDINLFSASANLSVAGGEMFLTGRVGNESAIFLNSEPTLSAAGYFVRGTIGSLGSGTEILRLRAKMNSPWESPFNNVTLIIYADNRLILERSGETNIEYTLTTPLAVNDVFELQITNNGEVGHVLRNGAAVHSTFSNVDISMVPDTRRVALGIKGSWGISYFETGNL